jgi:ABC-type amino acid transport substrate-binding protein
MTDERMDALLLRMDVSTEPDPAFVSATLEELQPRVRAARVEDMSRIGRLRRDLRLAVSAGSAAIPDAGRSGRRRTLVRRGIPGLVLAAVAVAVLVVTVTVRPGQVDRRTGALPASIAESGVLRVGVTSGPPQLVGSGQPQGFDIDVAREIGRRLGVGVQATTGTVDELLAAGGSPRDAVLVALPPGQDGSGTLAGTPYLWRAGAVVTTASAPITRIGDLAGRTMCVVAGGEAAAWLDGSLTAEAVTEPAPGVTTTMAPTLDGCLARLADGTATAAIADWGYDTIALPSGLVVAPVSPFAVPAAPRVVADTADAPGLLDAMNTALDAMRADGTLANLSRHRFAGLDLTTRP